MNKKTVKDIDVNGKKVLVRCDFNVPIDSETGEITDNRRIRAALPTIQYLLDHNAKVILCSHLGRPKGEFNLKYSLKPVAEELSKLLNKDVKLAKDVIGESAKELVEDFHTAVDDYLKLCEERGTEPERAYKGTFNIRISPELHKKAAIYAYEHKKSLNFVVESALAGFMMNI